MIDAPAELSETVREILEAGAACLTRFGNEKTNIQDVADAAGVSRATIYRYFTDRAHLLQAVTDYARAKVAAEVRARAAETTSLEEALAIIAELLAAQARRFHTREHLGNHDRGLAQYLSFQRQNRLQHIDDLVRPYVQRADQSGGLATDCGIDDAVDWIVLILASIATLPGSDVLNPDDPAALGAAFARRICQGLNAAPGAARRTETVRAEAISA